VIPIALRLSGFLSYRQPVDLDFTSFSLACISGANGAGKSSLLDAITWALFGQARKRDDSVINSHPEVSGAEVVFIFEYESNVYRVQRTAPRGKPTLLEFYIRQQAAVGIQPETGELPGWKVLTERTQRETQDCIEETLGMDYETFINASFFLQGKTDMFTQQRPGDRKRILGSILNLGQWDIFRQRAADERKDVEFKVTTIQGRLGEINAELDEETTRRERLAELEAGLAQLGTARQAQESALESARHVASVLVEQRRLVESHARQVEAAARRLADIQSRLETRQKERQALTDLLGRADQVQAAHTAWQEARRALEKWELLAGSFRQLERQRQQPLAEIIAERSRLEQELSGLQTAQVTAQEYQAGLPGLQTRLETARQALEEAHKQLDLRAQLEADLTQARERLAEARAENPRLRLEMDELKAYLAQIEQPGEAACPFCGQPLNPQDRQRLIEELQVKGTEKGDRYRQNKVMLEQADELVIVIAGQIQSLSGAQAAFQAHTRTTEQLTAQLAQAETALQAWQQQGVPRQVEIQQQLAQEDYRLEARQLLAQIDAEMQALGYDAAAHQSAREQEAAGRQAEAELRELDRAQATLVSLDQQIEELTTQQAAAQVEAESLQAEYAAEAASLAAAQAQAPDVGQLEQSLFTIKEHENQSRLEVGAARQKVEILADLKERRLSLECDMEKLNLLVKQYRQLERAFSKDGVPALLIEQALPQIEERANHILDRLSGGAMSVRFITQAQYKDKRRDDLRETLDIQISDGSGVRDYEMYSGGEAFRVNFAVRLALSEVLAQRAGARLQMLVIDEGFGSQDAQGRQRLVEAINLVKDDFAKILVITHIEELKDAFPVRIEVEKTPAGSQLRLT
jgi:exonuclease SbcC